MLPHFKMYSKWSFVASLKNNFPDALAGGAYGAKIGAAMILINPNDLNSSPSAKSFINANKGSISKIQLFGGTAAISDKVKGQLEGLI